MKDIKCVIVGDENVGKSCMISTYVNNKFSLEYIPTGCLGNGTAKNVEVDGEDFNLGIYDFSFDDFDLGFRYICYPGTDVFIICFSLISPSSFASAESEWLPEIIRKNPSIPIILVGTKLDLIYDAETLRKLRLKKLWPISIKGGENLAKKFGAVKYMECSSLTKEGLKEVFETAVRLGSKRIKPEKKASRGFFSSMPNLFRYKTLKDN